MTEKQLLTNKILELDKLGEALRTEERSAKITEIQQDLYNAVKDLTEPEGAWIARLVIDEAMDALERIIEGPKLTEIVGHENEYTITLPTHDQESKERQ